MTHLHRKVILNGKYGMLTFIEEIESKKYTASTGRLIIERMGLFICDCGEYFVGGIIKVKSGNTKSCGCLLNKRWSIHGKAGTPVYHVWQNMKSRCYDPNSIAYKNYGGRGIIVCKRWLASFVNFYKDMGDRPSPKHSLERINNNGNYTPKNCKWATQREQIMNRSVTVKVKYNGADTPISAIAETVGMPYLRLKDRIHRGYTIEEAINLPLNAKRKYTI